MATRSQKIRLAAFIFLAAAALGLVIAAIAGRGFFRATHTYYLRTDQSVEGLERGAPVKVLGVRVGEVRRFHLYPDGYDGVVVSLSVQAGSPIPRESIAVLKYHGITGLRLVDIVEGDPTAGMLPPGSEIPVELSALDLIGERAADLLAAGEHLLANLTMLTGPEAASRLLKLSDRAEAALVDIEAAAAEVRATVEAGRRGAEATVAELGQAAREARLTLAEARELMSDAGEAVGGARRVVDANREPLRRTVQNLRLASERLRDLARRLEQDPSRLLFTRPPPERRRR
jgi:ABC-type transporter Mla subunit MlaD